MDIVFGDSYTCTYCLKVIKWDHHRSRPTRDHFFPRSRTQSATDPETSLVLCCQPCNSRKSDTLFTSIDEVREFIQSGRKTDRSHSR